MNRFVGVAMWFGFVPAACSSLAMAVLHAADPSAPFGKPNVLLIYSDDHGWADLGVQGVDQDVRTPHLDQLARDGVLFKRGYVTAPQCTPSRAAVITGRHQQRFGVEQNGLPMRLEVLTLPERLKSANYVSGISGKWHLDIFDERSSGGERNKFLPELLPHAQGFDEYFTGFTHDYLASHALDGTPFPDAPHKVRDPRFRITIQTEAALSFLGRRAKRPEQPWFHYVSFMAPHVPLESPEPWFAQTPAHLPTERRQALAMIAAIDEGVGRIRSTLKNMGQEQNTLIFFIGDNGAPLGNVWDGSINAPLVGQKGMLSEGGIRVPFVAAWPGHIPAGQVVDHPVSSLDVAATAVSLAGISAPVGTTRVDAALDGVNLLPFLVGESKAAPHDALYWRWGSQAAVLEMPYKLITLGDRERLLFDLTRPDGENIDRNLIAQHPDIAARLEAKLKTWANTLQTPGLPTSFDRHHEDLFVEHNLIAGLASSRLPSGEGPYGTVQDWRCRNGTLLVKDGALLITRDVNSAEKARTFFTTTSVDLNGPVTATLCLRAKQGGRSTVTWRTKQQSEFLPENVVHFDWPASAEWQKVKLYLSAKGRLIHLRIAPANAATGLEVQSIELRGNVDATRQWRFDSTK